MSFVPSFPPQVPVSTLVPQSSQGTHPPDAPQPLQQAAPGVSSSSTGEAAGSETTLVDKLVSESKGAPGQRRGSVLDSLVAGAENMMNKAADLASQAEKYFNENPTAKDLQAKVDNQVSSGQENVSAQADKVDTDKIADKVEDLHLDKKAEEVADRGKGFLDQVAATFNSVANTIDEKTKSANQPGLITQIKQGAASIGKAADNVLDSGNLGAAGGGGVLSSPSVSRRGSAINTNTNSSPSYATAAAAAVPGTNNVSTSNSSTKAPESAAPSTPAAEPSATNSVDGPVATSTSGGSNGAASGNSGIAEKVESAEEKIEEEAKSLIN